MAYSDKNIVITPNNGSSTDDPKIVFTSANAAVGPLNITLRAYPINGGMLSFEGASGQLFSIIDSLSGTLFAVNDVSGLPSLEVLDTGYIRAAQYSGNMSIGFAVDNATDRLQVNGTTVSTQFKSSVTTGTAPLVINSTTMVSNLNSELLSGQNSSYYLNASNFTGTLADARLTSNVPLKNAANIFAASQTLSPGTSTSNTDWLLLQPSDYGTSKPRLYINKTSTATQYDIGLFDGTNNNGTINFNVQNLNLRGTALMATNTALTASQMPALTGDITTSAGSVATALATVNGNVGSFGSASLAPVITVNAKGLITAVSTQTIAPAWSSITTKPTTLGGFGITDAVNSATTYLGLVGNVALENTAFSALGWANLPVGYSKMMFSNGGTGSGYPIASGYGYFTKIANRDAGNGWAGMWIGHGTGQSNADYFGWTNDGTTYAGWRKIWTSSNQGASSGLDADLLDGQQGSFYQTATNLTSGTLPDARLSVNIPRVYPIPEIGGTAGWMKLGTFTVSTQTGNTILITLVTHNGYSSSISQDAITTIYFKTANGANFDANGFSGDSFYYTIGRSTGAVAAVKWKANGAGAAALSYDLYLSVGNYTSNGLYTVDTVGGTWTHAGTVGQTDPGVSSNTVCTASNEYYINGNIGWHMGNDGAGSGLDADLLDGQDSTYFRNATNINAGTLADTYLPSTMSAKTFSGTITANNGTITSSTPTLSAVQTWNSGAATFNAINVNVTDTASSSSSTLLNLQTGGVDRFKVFKDGAISTNGTSAIAAVTFGSTISLTSISTPSTITADTNDYFVAAGVNLVRLASDANRTLTGLTNGSSGRLLTLHNVGSYSIYLSGENASSSSANRFGLSSTTLEIKSNSAVLLQYDATSSRWRVLGGAGGSSNASELVSGTIPDARLSPNVALVNATNTFSLRQQISASNATTATEYLRFTPTDVGVGKPYMYIGSNANAAQWDFGLSNAVGVINFASQVTAPTVSVTDSTSNVATTAFVQGAIANAATGTAGAYDGSAWDSRSYDGFSPIYATGTGSSQNITLPTSDLVESSIWVTVDNVLQPPNSYTISGSTLTITAPALSNVCVRGGGFKGQKGDTGASAVPHYYSAATSSYTLQLIDSGGIVENNSGGTLTVTVPTDSSVAFPVGTQIIISRNNNGAVNISGGGSVSINGVTSTVALGGGYAGVILYKRATNSWVAFGNLL